MRAGGEVEPTRWRGEGARGGTFAERVGAVDQVAVVDGGVGAAFVDALKPLCAVLFCGCVECFLSGRSSGNAIWKLERDGQCWAIGCYCTAGKASNYSMLQFKLSSSTYQSSGIFFAVFN